MTTILGIDPGANGAIAVISDSYIDCAPIPRAGKAIDWAELAILIDEFRVAANRNDLRAVAYVEKVHAMPKQGVSSSFTFGVNVGGIHGVLGALDIPMALTTPQCWKKRVLAGTTKDKAAAIAWCRQRYPSISLLATPRSRTPHDGMAEAMCIAHYGTLQHAPKTLHP